MQKISKTLAVLGLLAPSAASALGIGEIKLHSSLNESLRAEIPLVLSGSETVDDVKVKIAPPEAFARAGIDRHFNLTRLRFTPVKKGEGRYVIQVSSPDAILEPFLNFLVEVNWPQGKLLREFTVLLDPPSTFKEEAAADVDLPVRAPSARYIERPARGGESSAQSSREPTRTAATPAPKAHTAAPIRKSQPQLSDEQYGPIRRDETLWGIARTLARRAGVSTEAMMEALYDANPHAFFKDSYNALKAGQTLKIPDSQWLQAHSGQVRPRSGAPSASGALTQRKQSQPTRVTSTQKDTAEAQTQLKLLAPSTEKSKGEAASTGKDEAGKNRGDIALEVADTVKQENEEIRSRLAQLEQQLSTMQRLINLKDEQIAVLQGKQKPAEPEQKPEAGGPQGTGTVTAPKVPTEPTAVAPPAQPAVPAPKDVKPEPPLQQVTPTPPPTPEVPAPKPMPPVVAPTPTPAPAVTAPPPVPKPPKPAIQAPVPAPAPSAATADTPFWDSGSFALAGGFAATIALLGAYVLRRRARMIEETESILSAPPMVRDRTFDITPTSFSADETPSEQVAPAAKSSFLSEFTSSDFNALGGEVDEVDPISEADVYLAYGRYKQAEELIRHAIETHPDRDECKLKLLEIHYATENRDAFEQYAQQLFDEHKDANPDFWEKVVEMGTELCPGSALFTRESPALRKIEAEEFSMSSDIAAHLDLDEDLLAELRNFEIGNTEPAGISSRAGSSSRATDSVALGGGHGKRESVATVSKSTTEERAPLDFVVPPSSSRASVAANTSEVESPDNLIHFESIRSLKPSNNAQASTSQPSSSANDAEDSYLLDFENGLDSFDRDMDSKLDGLNFDKPAAAPVSSGAIRTQANSNVAQSVEIEGFESLDTLNEYETKLDLAKAFVDMGDESSAKDILEDVLAHGNTGQQQEARALLGAIGGG